MDETPSVSELEEIAKADGHAIEIEEKRDGNISIYRPVCACGWTLRESSSGNVQLGWRYGKHNAEKVGNAHILDVAMEKINQTNKKGI